MASSLRVETVSPSAAWYMAGTEIIFVVLKHRASILPANLYSVIKEKAYEWGMGSSTSLE